MNPHIQPSDKPSDRVKRALHLSAIWQPRIPLENEAKSASYNIWQAPVYVRETFAVTRNGANDAASIKSKGAQT
jgi:hypothetical protein